MRRRSLSGKRIFDIALSATILAITLPTILLVAIAIKLDSRGPVFYRARRVGYRGSSLAMLKFRKMHADAKGPALTADDDDRFTRVGRFLALTKLDELPQLWNVLRGEMSIIGPRPEDPSFVELHREAYEVILGVRPGITGLTQLAFAKESSIPFEGSRLDYYVTALLPQKIGLDVFYATRRSFRMDLWIFAWTALAVVLRRDVAVHRGTGRLTVRRPRVSAERTAAPESSSSSSTAAASMTRA